ncbi:MAG: universal stress protein [Desulfitobacteriaceae bacterium]|nr:universal stress protein [Desulfitobacteriaceae bacterium]MDD4345810.1 universal stress protein [Desulfitobacteriaceae bacterium]MDD4400793.1 universal stress protein [Desulfitobacteriaceae bacterium]
MFKKVLVPTDASEFSRRALKTALELARLYKAEVELLHVTYTPQAYWGYTVSYGITISQEELERNGELVLEAAITGIDTSGVPFKKCMYSGYPASVILEEIKKEQIDLVIMGSHGYGPITGSVLGSVSQRVLQRAECPVMIVK